MPGLRGALVLVLLLGAGVFVASVFFDPVDDGGFEPPEVELATTGRQEFDDNPVAVGSFDPDPQIQTGDREDIADTAPTFSLDVAAMEYRSREPIPGAQVRYRRVGTEEWTTRKTKVNGQLEIARLAGGSWEIQVACPGYFPSEIQQAAIPRTGSPIEFELLKAGHVEGTISGVDGSRVNFGLIRFVNQETGESKSVKPSSRGSFLSPPLKGGAWTVDWVEQPNSLPDSRLPVVLGLAPGERRKIEIQIFREGMKIPPGAEVGTRVLK